jgi:hypothetical protein
MPAPGDEATTHVGQAIVPVVVIVPPVMGIVVAMLVTVPLPPPEINKFPLASTANGA